MGLAWEAPANGRHPLAPLRKMAQRFGLLDPRGRPGISHLLAVCPSPEPVDVATDHAIHVSAPRRSVPVRGSVKRNELDIRTPLKHPTDQGKVAASGPQPGSTGAR